MVNSYTECELLTLMIITAFMGFCIENIWLAFRKGYMDNRNMQLPFLLGYGIVAPGFYLIFGIPDEEDLKTYWVISFIAVSLSEILIGKATEHLFGFYYWDYTSIPLHITRYTSIPTSIGFACIITIFMRDQFLPLMTWISALPLDTYSDVVKGMVILLDIDFLYSFNHMKTTNALNERWRITLFKRNPEIQQAA